MTVRTRTVLKNQFIDVDPKDHNDDLVDSFGIGIAAVTGTIFYVDGTNGSDTANSGQSPDSAYQTLQTAIDACTADAGDVIILMTGLTITASLTVDCAGITIMPEVYGIAPMQPEKFAIYPSAAMGGPTMLVSQPCRLVGIEVVGRDTTPTYTDDMTGSGAAIAMVGNAGAYAGGFCEIAYCRFVDWWGNPYGIEFGAGAYNHVHHCTFEGFDAGILFRGTSLRNPDHNRVEYCHFVDNTNGIDHYVGGCTAHNFVYKSNTFVDYTDAIDFNNQASDGLVCDNWYETATDAATYDITVAAAQALGINFSGNNYSE